MRALLLSTLLASTACLRFEPPGRNACEETAACEGDQDGDASGEGDGPSDADIDGDEVTDDADKDPGDPAGDDDEDGDGDLGAAVTIDLTFASTSFPSSVHVTRGSSGTFVAADGYLTTVLENEPRLSHVASATSFVLEGLLIERASTNLLRFSNSLAEWTLWNASQTTDYVGSPDRALTPSLVVSTGNTASAFTNYAPPTPGVHAFSVFVHAPTPPTAWDLLTRNSADGGPLASVSFHGNGTVNTSYNVLATHRELLGGGWMRLGMVFSLSAGIVMEVRGTFVQPRQAFTLWGVQLEPGSSVTSYIPTMVGAGSRAADQVWIDVPPGPAMVAGGALAAAWRRIPNEELPSPWHTGVSLASTRTDSEMIVLGVGAVGTSRGVYARTAADGLASQRFVGRDSLAGSLRLDLSFDNQDALTVAVDGTPSGAVPGSEPVQVDRLWLGYAPFCVDPTLINAGVSGRYLDGVLHGVTYVRPPSP